ncbi:Histidine protein kinase saeS [Chryseobacterium gleum]|uniref:histidine kinase n=2 Tax=Chryseobacterium gleum TaxID=250 RepID=A0A3S4MD33_CHRGE|nr:ATP-binding protein [Chryseobacterium gleum]EFK36264.1 ATPase/histidine kinase/DNA gyrase B/HSP90 domain protein [Chryseobacterium gleum ATCC 35910]QQY33515.1 ATP-binding protein [Chryseobacterium gleum]VEE08587.1 Histidine protein kinase saeS [Chryseobacterium gleum]
MSRENLHFKTNIQIKNIIGKDLINDDNIAILELVKNSFDADAKKVKVTFKNLKENDDLSVEQFSKNTSRIIIEDDGVGMNFTDIQNKWLNIAYSEKKENNHQYNRMMAGAKGVGRFSCDRLGEYLNLYTKTGADNEFLKLSIDWKLFEVNDIKKEINEIILDYSFLNKSEFDLLGFDISNHGVVLEIIKLRSKWVYSETDKDGNTFWDTEKFTNLKKYLEKLINPNQAFEKNDFGIFISAPEFESENSLLEGHKKFLGQVENTIFEKLDFQSTSIESSIIENGSVIYTELKDKGETIFWIKELNEYYPLIKNASITLYYLNPYAKAFFTKQTGIRSVDYGSIFLFINGFRIPPYGEVGNDWLGIDQRKAQGFARFIGLREFVGRIEILDDNNDFQIVSSREGIVKNENYKALTLRDDNKSYFFKTLRRLERYVVEGLDWDSIPEELKNKIAEIEKKIISGETKEEDLLFREEADVKRNRVYESIHNIIGARADTVLELYINEELILEKIQIEKENSEKEFERILDDFEKHKIDIDSLNQILLRKAEQDKALEKELNSLNRFTMNEATSHGILQLQLYKNRNKEQSNIILQLRKELEDAQLKQREAEEKSKKAADEVNSAKDELAKANAEVEKAKNELNETRSQNLFLKSVKSQDLDDIVNLMHLIGISTGTIQNYVKGTIYRLENNIEISNKQLKDVFSNLNFELNKIYSISKFATKANFKIDSKDSYLDLKAFIEEYLINISKPFFGSTIDFIVYDNDLKDFVTKFKPLEITIVLDNLINNSKKAISAKKLNESNINFKGKIEVDFDSPNTETLLLRFRDNGIGVSKEIQNKIFEYAFTTTEGSGLGLTHIQEILKKMNAKIEINKEYSDGAEFIITFKKNN